VLCDRLTRRSRPTLLFGSVDQRSRLAIGGETPHALEPDRSTPEDYERLKWFGACLTQQAAGPNRALRSTMPGLTVTAVRHFLHWPSRTSAGQGPTPASVGIHHGLLWLLKDLRLTWHR
jgi:hypothetical protein